MNVLPIHISLREDDRRRFNRRMCKYAIEGEVSLLLYLQKCRMTKWVLTQNYLASTF